MRLAMERRGRALIAGVAGRADSVSCDIALELQPLAAAIARSTPRVLAIDTRDLDYIDSAAFSELDRVIAPVRERGAVRFVGPGSGLARWLDLFEPRPKLPFFASVDDALDPTLAGAGTHRTWEAFWRRLHGAGTGGEEGDEFFVIDYDREVLHLAGEGAGRGDVEAFPRVRFDEPGPRQGAPAARPPCEQAEAQPEAAPSDDWRELAELRARLALDPLPVPREAIDWSEIIGADRTGPGGAEAAWGPAQGGVAAEAAPACRGAAPAIAADPECAEERPGAQPDPRRAGGEEEEGPASLDDVLARGIPAEASRERAPGDVRRLERRLVQALLAQEEAEERAARGRLAFAAERERTDALRRGLASARERIAALEGEREARARERPPEVPRVGAATSTWETIAVPPDATIARRRAVEGLEAVVDAFARDLRLDCDGLREAVAALARVAERAPHESYDPVVHPAGERGGGLRVANVAAMAMVLEGARSSDPVEARATGLLAALDVIARGSPILRGGAGPSREQRLFQLARTEYFRPLWEERRCPIRDPEDVRRRMGEIEAIERYWDEILSRGAEPPLAVASLLRPGSGVAAEVRRAFVEAFSLYPRGSWVKLSDGEIGVVVAPRAGLPECPIVVRLYRTREGRIVPRAPSIAVAGREPWMVKVSGPVRDPLRADRPGAGSAAAAAGDRYEGGEEPVAGGRT